MAGAIGVGLRPGLGARGGEHVGKALKRHQYHLITHKNISLLTALYYPSS
jgi:hypothetical protein